MDESHCSLFYKKLNNNFTLSKTYFKSSKTGYYVNGDAWGGFDTIFKKIKKSTFKNNLKKIFVPLAIQ